MTQRLTASGCPGCGRAYGVRRRCYYCQPARKRSRVPCKCAGCGGAFEVQTAAKRKGEGVYCSRTCTHRAMRGVELVTGTRYVRKDGYVAIKVGVRMYELEHRLVMEEILGRELTADEHVHHIDGDRQDNGPENLMVLTNADHQRLHIAQGDSGLCKARRY